MAAWRDLHSDDDARFDKEVVIDADALTPYVTWGTRPGQGLPLSGCVPDPASFQSESEQASARQALRYMGLEPGTPPPLREIAIDTVFIGSCTNSRIEDLRAAAEVLRGRRIAEGLRMLVVPGSMRVRMQAMEEHLDDVFIAAGAEWRMPGCSMCIGMNGDRLAPQERSASTTNRNFENRQGQGGRTHLVSPVVAAANRGARHAFPRPKTSTDSPTRPCNHSRPMSASACRCARKRRHGPRSSARKIPSASPRTGYEDALFATWRRNDKAFVLNHAVFGAGSVLVAGPDFGTGSSREHAVWALMDYGFRVVISSAFADIFRGNAGKAGLVLAQCAQRDVDELWTALESEPGLRIAVDPQRKGSHREGILLRLHHRRIHAVAAARRPG